MSNDERLVDLVFKKIKAMKYKMMNIDDVSEILRGILGDSYTSEIGVSVKGELKVHEGLDFFREGDYICESKYHYCTGNWLSIKGIYKNPVECKFKMGWYAWQLEEDIDWDKMD